MTTFLTIAAIGIGIGIRRIKAAIRSHRRRAWTESEYS